VLVHDFEVAIQRVEDTELLILANDKTEGRAN